MIIILLASSEHANTTLKDCEVCSDFIFVLSLFSLSQDLNVSVSAGHQKIPLVD